MHRQQHGGRGERCRNAGGLLGLQIVKHIEISPTTIEVLIAVGEINLLLRKNFQGRLFCGILRGALIEATDRAQAVGVTPGVVGRGRIGPTQQRQLVEHPLFSFHSNGIRLLAWIAGIDQARESQAAGTGEKGIMCTGQWRVYVQTLGAMRATPRAVGILLRQQLIDPAGDRCRNRRRCDRIRRHKDHAIYYARRSFGFLRASEGPTNHQGDDDRVVHAPGVMTTWSLARPDKISTLSPDVRPRFTATREVLPSACSISSSQLPSSVA